MGISIVRLIKQYEKQLEYIVPVILILGAAVYSICNAYGFLIFPDEYTYWTYAATAAGYDWSAITSLGAYYSYGYSMILIPIFYCCKNPVTAYRVAVGVNFVLLLLAFFCLSKTSGKMQSDKKVPVVLFSAAVIFYSGHLFSAQMTLTEILIMMLYIAAGSLLYQYLENNSVVSLVFLILTLIYTYVVHMRTVGVLLSALVVLLFHMLSGRGRKRHLIWLIGLMAVLLIASDLVKEWSYVRVFGGLNRELVSGNDYSGQLAKIRYLFTLSGFYDTVVHILGKILYLGLSTFGLFYFGIYGLVRTLLSGQAKPANRSFSAYILLTVAAQIVIATIYLLTLGEISDYTYGRYNEFILPYVMLAGMITVWKMERRAVCIMSVGVAALHLPLTGLVVKQIYDVDADTFCGYFMAGISWLYKENQFSVTSFYIEAYLAGTAAMALVMVLILFSRGGRGREKFLTALFIMELSIAIRADHIFLQPFKYAAYRDYRLSDKIEQLCMGKEEPHILFRYGNYPSYIGIIQFMMRNRKIDVTDRITGETINDDTILIFPYDDAEQDKWIDQFTDQDTYGHFTILYNN